MLIKINESEPEFVEFVEGLKQQQLVQQKKRSLAMYRLLMI
ncbi:hypothetical protein GAB14E_3966 [Colwellia psychrerythraea]|uniref:Uncharacterized protein n=1 Tax=Colwellia psychrerythraea TaxID=28229 RepID=A0A099KHR4_COLPS|nr:hypothetical protein GAB14E_3966 [Colwellia psychrerythraea]